MQAAFHHNPTVAYDASTETFLLISIGAGNATGTQNCTGTNGDAFPEEGSVRLVGDPAQAGIITLSYSKTASGPWTTLKEPILSGGGPGKWDEFVTNPSVYIFENGTVIMAYRGMYCFAPQLFCPQLFWPQLFALD